MMIKDINDILPKFLNMKWGALLNWKPSDAEVNHLISSSPFPNDAKWHTLNKHNNNMIVDGHEIRKTTTDKLT